MCKVFFGSGWFFSLTVGSVKPNVKAIVDTGGIICDILLWLDLFKEFWYFLFKLMGRYPVSNLSLLPKYTLVCIRCAFDKGGPSTPGNHGEAAGPVEADDLVEDHPQAE
ncbi:hypothetical protein V6N12_048460 [Hibiscus sabdariffa]|uniref:Uncharacterized protein n=1 Tax=Hibiscus sabdariffa TaxID=183260 RepID=A0ABR2EHB4_9ROSI